MGEAQKVPWGTPQPEIESVDFDDEAFYEGLRSRIKQKRIERGITQQTLAEALGVPHASVWRMEHNTMPSVATCIKLQKILSIPLTELLGTEGEDVGDA